MSFAVLVRFCCSRRVECFEFRVTLQVHFFSDREQSPPDAGSLVAAVGKIDKCMLKRSLKILVVDSDVALRSHLQVALAGKGCEVLESSNGIECLSTVVNHQVDIVLLDSALPDIDGFQCCELMHTRLEEHCPNVVIMIPVSDTSFVDKAFAAKATDFITKPIHPPLLWHRIGQISREWHLRKELEQTQLELEHASRTDELTALANRHFFQATLAKEWKRLAREQKPLGVLHCDLDKFKEYNAAYGSRQGDRCLQEFASVLKACAERPTDFVARYAGEEFLLLMPNTAAEGLKTIDAKIRDRLASRAIPHSTSTISNFLTYSAGGVVTVPQPAEAPDRLISNADNALYEAKSQGGNCLVIRSLVSSV